MASEWRQVSLGELYDYRSGLSKPRSAFGFGYPFLTFKDVFYNYFVPDKLSELVDSTNDERDRCSVRKGDVFLTRTSETMDELGMSAVALSDYENATFNGFCKRLRPRQTAVVDPKYTAFFFRSPWFRRSVTAMSSMSTRASLNHSMLDRLQMILPPLDEQQRIAAVLGALDDKIELNRKMNRTLEEMAQAIFRSWFDSFHNEKMFVRVQDLVASGELLVSDGYRAKRAELAETGLPFARAANINDGFRFDEAELLGPSGVEKAKYKVSQPFDVVFTSKGTVGRFAFVKPGTRRFAYSPQLCFWRSLSRRTVSPYFLLYWMQSPEFLHQVDAVKSQTDMADYVSLRDQRRMSIFLPSPAEQELFEGQVAPLVGRQAHCTIESRTLAVLRDTLLPKLISGEIRVPEAEKAAEAVL